MMMHHSTKFWNKMFGGLEDIIWANTDILTLRSNLDLECSKKKISQDSLDHDDLSSDLIWC